MMPSTKPGIQSIAVTIICGKMMMIMAVIILGMIAAKLKLMTMMMMLVMLTCQGPNSPSSTRISS